MKVRILIFLLCNKYITIKLKFTLINGLISISEKKDKITLYLAQKNNNTNKTPRLRKSMQMYFNSWFNKIGILLL